MFHGRLCKGVEVDLAMGGDILGVVVEEMGFDPDHLVGAEFRSNLLHRMVQMVEYAAGNDPGRFSYIMSS